MSRCVSIPRSFANQSHHPCSWDADAIVENVTDEDGEVYEGAPENNVWRVQAHQASAISCLRWNPVDSQTVGPIPVSTEVSCSIPTHLPS